ncbi:hypothetical protein Q3G72_022924 [Acer saccharum]|nr:hypothetical protein Q3G72_022924 [Acer saccharum]
MVEKGSHSELLRDPDGAYAQLIRLQDFLKGFSADAKMMYEEASQVANDAVGIYNRDTIPWLESEEFNYREVKSKE